MKNKFRFKRRGAGEGSPPSSLSRIRTLVGRGPSCHGASDSSKIVSTGKDPGPVFQKTLNGRSFTVRSSGSPGVPGGGVKMVLGSTLSCTSL